MKMHSFAVVSVWPVRGGKERDVTRRVGYY
jgi:hypothetical protein